MNCSDNKLREVFRNQGESSLESVFLGFFPSSKCSLTRSLRFHAVRFWDCLFPIRLWISMCVVKNLLAIRRLGFSPWVGKMPWRRACHSTPVFLLGESHGQRSLAGYSPRGHKESDTTERLSIAQHL